MVRLRLRAARCNWQDSQRIGSKLRHSPFQCFQLRIQLLATPTTRWIASFYPPRANHLRSQSRNRMIAREVSGHDKNQDYCSLLRLCASLGHFDGLRSTVEGCYEPFNRRNRGSAANSHPADPPAMAVPEALCHPFATAKIVVWTRTRSVRGRPIAVRRDWGNATLCACGRSSERTDNCCGRDKCRSCLLHSRPSCACMACGHAIAAPSTTLRNSRRCMSTPERAIVSGQLSTWMVAGFELLVARS